MNLKVKSLPIPLQFPVMSMLADRKEKNLKATLPFDVKASKKIACEMKEGKCVNKPGRNHYWSSLLVFTHLAKLIESNH